MIFCRRNRVATRVTFVLPFDEPSGEVSVVGDFNDWQPGAHVLTRSTYGTRAVSVTLPSDRRYVFRYLTNDGKWFDEPETDLTDGSIGVVMT